MRIWLQRQRYFLDLTLSSLLRRRSKNAALLLVYSLIVFMVASVLFFTNAIRREARALLEEAPELIVQRTLAGRHDVVPLSYAEAIARLPGVQVVRGRLWGYYFHPAARANYTVMAPEAFSHADDETAIGDGVLRTWGTSRDDRLFFRAYNGEPVILRIASTFSDKTDLVSSDLILTSEATFRKLFGIPNGYATDLVVSIRNQKECSTIAEKIVRMLPDARPIQKVEILRTYTSLFDWRSGYIIVLLSGAVLAFFIFAWDKATGLSAEERSEIGILKAIGWDTSDVLMMKLWEGTVISLSAFLLGATAAYVHVFVVSAPLFEHALKGWAVLYPNFRLSPSVDTYQLAVLFALVTLPYACVTVVPAWKAAVTDPDAVMR